MAVQISRRSRGASSVLQTSSEPGWDRTPRRQETRTRGTHIGPTLGSSLDGNIWPVSVQAAREGPLALPFQPDGERLHLFHPLSASLFIWTKTRSRPPELLQQLEYLLSAPSGFDSLRASLRNISGRSCTHQTPSSLLLRRAFHVWGEARRPPRTHKDPLRTWAQS